MNTPPIKKIVLWLLTIFLLYAILTSPTEAANIVGSAWDVIANGVTNICLLYTSPSPRDRTRSRMPSSA